LKPSTAIKELRAHHAETQHEFAARIGLSRRAIANYEGNRVPTLSVLAKLAQVALQAKRRDLQDVFAESISKQIGLKDAFWSADWKRGARRGFLLAAHGLDARAETSTGRERGAFLMLNVEGENSTGFVNAFLLVMESYLYPTSNPHEMSSAQAEQLLFDFEENVIRVHDALPRIERARKKK
jgi:transcriptional regulator with XRE-family HTH domain